MGALYAGDFGRLFLFAGLLGQDCRSGDVGQNRRNGGFLQVGIRRRVAIEPLGFDGFILFDIFDEDGVVLGTKCAAGIVALFLGGGNLAIEATQEVDHFGVVGEIGFRVIGVGEFLEEDLGE